MRDERIWHGIRFTFDAYYEFHHSTDQYMQIDIISREVIDMAEASCWPHYIPVSKEDWAVVEDEFTAYIIEQLEEDIAIAEQERQVERMLIERDLQRYDY